MWRAIYWIKLPGFDRKLKVAFSWLLDTIIPIESVQLKMTPSKGVINFHYEKGEVIFNEGDIGDYFYIIVKGEVEIVKKSGNDFERVAVLSAGEYFGEMAILRDQKRSATVRCLTPVDVLALRNKDFGAIMANLQELKTNFEKKAKERADEIEKIGKKNKIA
jgi:CRP-like cAMP-binding protein